MSKLNDVYFSPLCIAGGSLLIKYYGSEEYIVDAIIKYLEGLIMLRDELISEISMRRDIPMEYVEEVLDEEDFIYAEEERCKKKKRCIVATIVTTIIVTAIVVACIVGKKKEIDVEKIVRKYIDKYRR